MYYADCEKSMFMREKEMMMNRKTVVAGGTVMIR